MKRIPRTLFGLFAVAALAALLVGCPPPDGNGDTTPPTVTVNPLTTSDPTPSLNGTVSENNATISVSVSGQSVSATNNNDGTWTLAGNTLSALSDGTYDVQVTATDNAGNTANDSTTNELVIDTTEPQLYISNFAGNNVTSYANPSTVNGNIAPGTNLAGTNTQLNQPSDNILDADGSLLVSNFGTPSVSSYANAATANGNLSPDRLLQGAATQLNSPTTLAALTSQDLLFVADSTTNDILVYSSVSGSGFNGNAPPTRTISSAALNSPFGINFGSGDTLYVANNGGNNILVFDNASTLNGAVTPTRTISSAAFANIYDVFIDEDNDRMMVVNAVAGEIHTFEGASTLNGTVAPDFTLTVQGAAFLTSMVMGSDGVGYIVDNTAGAVYSYDNVSTLNGALNPDRTIQGSATQLNGPIRVFLAE